MKRYCLTLDLKNDRSLIEEYKKYHQQIWPEIELSIRSSGILNMEIYLLDTRMFMIMDTEDNFSFSEKQKRDEANPKVAEWETLMSTFQQTLPGTQPGQKWMLMEKIFQL